MSPYYHDPFTGDKKTHLTLTLEKTPIELVEAIDHQCVARDLDRRADWVWEACWDKLEREGI